MLIENALRFYDDLQISLARLNELISLSEAAPASPEYAYKLADFLKTLYDTCPLFTISPDVFKNDLSSLKKELEALLSHIDKESLLKFKNISVEETEEDKETLTLGVDGEVVHWPKLNFDEYYCDSCSYLRFLDNPDPLDPMRWSDEDAVCSKTKKVIAERVSVSYMDKIPKPAFCPKNICKK